MQKTILDFEISSKGIRNEEHPTGFKHILIYIHLKSPNVSEVDLKKVIKLAEEKYCPVWSMINENVQLEIEYMIIGC